MTAHHAWKRRLWGQDYPFENGPPYRNPSTGAPMLPGGAQGGPLNGVGDDGPSTGNPVTVAFTGPATGDVSVLVLIEDNTAGAPPNSWVGAQASVASGTSADDIATAVAADFTARNWDRWVSAVAATNTVTFTPQAAGTATINVLYEA